MNNLNNIKYENYIKIGAAYKKCSTRSFFILNLLIAFMLMLDYVSYIDPHDNRFDTNKNNLAMVTLIFLITYIIATVFFFGIEDHRRRAFAVGIAILLFVLMILNFVTLGIYNPAFKSEKDKGLYYTKLTVTYVFLLIFYAAQLFKGRQILGKKS